MGMTAGSVAEHVWRWGVHASLGLHNCMFITLTMAVSNGMRCDWTMVGAWAKKSQRPCSVGQRVCESQSLVSKGLVLDEASDHVLDRTTYNGEVQSDTLVCDDWHPSLQRLVL